MRLNLRDIIHAPGSSIPFEFEMDLTQLELYGQQPVAEPVRVRGIVRNMAGALQLEGTASSRLHLTCDRCGKPFLREKSVPLDTLLATELEDEENDEIVLLDGTELDLDDLAQTEFILGMDTKNLCSEDCKGLCPRCGADLNLGPCGCKPEADPRLAALAQLLDDSAE
jgi:uncharacterized protein